jgi:hypothetical protein
VNRYVLRLALAAAAAFYIGLEIGQMCREMAEWVVEPMSPAPSDPFNLIDSTAATCCGNEEAPTHEGGNYR